MPILRDVIHDRVIFAKSADAGLTVIEAEPDGKMAGDVQEVWASREAPGAQDRERGHVMAKPNPLKNATSEVAESLLKASDRPQAAQEPARIKPTGSKSSRKGKRFIGLYVDPMRHDEIKQAAMDEDIKLQDLMRQAIDEWMERNGQEVVRAVAARHERREKREG